MGFVQPLWLFGLAALVPLWGVLRGRESVRAQRRAMLGLSADTRRAARVAAPLLLAAAGFLALARPHWGFEEITVRSVGRDIVVVLDASLSMRAKDIPPNRLEFAKRKVLDLTDWVATHTPGDRVGLVLFAGSSYTYCPLTADYEVIRLFTRSVSTELISSGGSGLTSALKSALKSFESDPHAGSIIVILSDGEDSTFQTEQSAALLRGSKARVLALGIGTPEGRPIEFDDGRFVRDRAGNIVLSKLQEQSLRALAEAGGGEYRRATLDERDFAPYLRSSASSAERIAGGTRTIRNYRELGPLLLFGVLTILAGAAIVKRHPALLCLMLVLAAEPGWAAPDQSIPSLFEAYRAYEEGDFERAYRGFQAARKSAAADPKIAQALGNAAFRLNRFDEAAAAFTAAAASAATGREKFEASYNLGNTLLAAKKFQPAIDSYDAALAVKPGDGPTEFNRALAEQLLQQAKNEGTKPEEEEEQNQKEQEKQKDSEPKKDSEDQKKDDSKQDPSETPESGSDQPPEEKQEGEQSTDQPTPEPGQSDSEGKPQDESKNEPASTPTPQSDSESSEKQSEPDKSEATPTPDSSGTEGSKTEKEPQGAAEAGKQNESDAAGDSKAWLQSLPESPLLLQRNVQKAEEQSDQSW